MFLPISKKKSDDFVKSGRLYFCEQPWATSHSKYTLQIRKLMYKSACIQLSYKGYPIPLFSPIESVCNNEHPKNMSDKTSTLSRPGLPNFPKTLFALSLGDLDLLKSILELKKQKYSKLLDASVTQETPPQTDTES